VHQVDDTDERIGADDAAVEADIAAERRDELVVLAGQLV